MPFINYLYLFPAKFMDGIVTDIAIIGAGAAGLLAAEELAKAGKKVVILEARNRIGGRIHSFYPQGISFPLEAGAEFIHGPLPLTGRLLQEGCIVRLPVAGDMVTVKQGRWQPEPEFMKHWETLTDRLRREKEEMTIAGFLQKYFHADHYRDLRESVRRFAEGYDGADINLASIGAVREEWLQEENAQYRVQGGYQTLMAYLEEQALTKGAIIRTSCAVKEIRWEKDKVRVLSAGGVETTARKLLVTIPIRLLQEIADGTGMIRFFPSLSGTLRHAHGIGCGAVIKVLLLFREAFWAKQRPEPGFILSDEKIPTWWTSFPAASAVLTGWLGGPDAAASDGAGEETLLQTAMGSLASIFHRAPEALQEQLLKGYVFNWCKDPFAKMAYSYDMLETKAARRVLNEPVADTIYFAGEALYEGPAPGTVEAALVSGQMAARKMLAAFAQLKT